MVFERAEHSGRNNSPQQLPAHRRAPTSSPGLPLHQATRRALAFSGWDDCSCWSLTRDIKLAPELLAQNEADVDSALNFDGLTIQQVGSIAPLADGRNGCRHKPGVSAHEREILNRSVCGDDGCKHNLSLDSSCPRYGWISRFNARDQVPCCHALGDAYPHGRRWSGKLRNRVQLRGLADDATDDASKLSSWNSARHPTQYSVGRHRWWWSFLFV